ncbi:MAG TPA: patatin-like phospholipase family protein, partial [Salinimicrobium sp.]|nr:patatin-like phospholipase family protein [Salinimicrobium sp.]
MKIRFFLLLMLICSFQGRSQEVDPEVGLVLSGGGAKGLAHIGALKIIEEAGVQIDYIGGTSMGAIIGSLYAAGYSAEQLDSIFHQTNFDVLLQDVLPRKAKSFNAKEGGEKYILSLPFDDFKITFPSGLSKGQNLFNLMSRLMLHLKDRKNFGHLPIPFFTVATDIETGEEVILDSGYLPLAVSASAAIPTLFSPVMIDGRLLTDGGVSNNYPVEELRKRGADIIIGVDVQDTLAGREDLKSIFDILTQISNFRTIRDMRGKIDQTDVYIDPAIAPFNAVSFDRGEQIIKAGEKAARKKIEDLKRVAAIQEKEPRENIEIPEIDSLYIADIRVTGDHDYPRAYIIGKLRFRYPTTISYEKFISGINNLSATGNFKMINYKLIPLNEGYVLELHLDEDPGKMFFKMALHYDDLYKTGVLLNLTRKSLLFSNDLASLDVVIGDNFRYNFEYYWDKGFYWSLGLKSAYNSFDKNVDVSFAENKPELSSLDVNRINIEYRDHTNQVYVQTVFEQIFSLGLGAEHKFLEVSSQTFGIPSENRAIPSTVFEDDHFFSVFGKLKLDTYDDSYLPGEGFFFNGDFHLYLFSAREGQNFSEFSIAKGEIGYAFSPLDKLTARISSGTGLRIGNNNNRMFNFFLGGYGNDLINNIIPFYGYDFLALSGDSYIKGMIEAD